VYKGYCRAFQENDGKEVNLNFFFEKEFITNIKSFTKKERSELSIQACENMVVVKIEKNKLIERVYNNSQEFEIFGRKMLELMIMKQDAHVNLFKLYTPQQRYEFIEKNRPEIIRRVALTQIASYLGVTRETLTRIRKRKLSKI
jgi:CRP-like cAMP-binding protein